MASNNTSALSTVPRDLAAGLVVSLVALPLCLGIALASNAPLFSGIVAGIVVIAVPGWSAVTLVIVTGVFFVLLGLLAVIQAFALGKGGR